MDSNTSKETGVSIEMPRYISCKPVWALKIARIEQAPAGQERMHAGGDWFLYPEEEGYGPVCVGHNEYVLKHNPKAGGYYVQYEDGYRSFSPSKPFEKGNTPREAWGIQREQEPKYGVNQQGRLFNRHTGTPIPDWEPVFILRAKDRRALAVLSAYLEGIPEADTATRAAVASVIERFRAFKTVHPALMKDGDSKAPPPPVPASINAQAPRTPERPARAPWPFPTSSRT